MSSSGGHYGGGDWGQSDDPWGQGEPTPPQPDQGQQGWVSPTQEWGGGSPSDQPAPGSWDTGPPPSSQNWDTGPPPPGQWDTAVPGGPPPGQAPPQGYDPGQPPPPGYDPGQQQPWAAGPPPPGGGYGPPPGGPPPPPPKSSNKGLIIGLTAGGGGLVVLILVIVLVVALSGSGSGGGPVGGGGGGGSAAERAVAWSVPEPTSENESATVSMFVANDNKTLVRISGVGMTGYNMSDGKQVWTRNAPDGAEVCSGTRSAPDGVAAILFGSDGRCTTVAAVDVSNGKQLWSTNVKVNDSDYPPRYGSVAAGQGKIWVSTSERVIKYDDKSPPANSGSAKPVSAAPKADSYCRVGGVLPTEKGALTTMRCSSSDNTYFLRLKPDTLEAEWQTKLDVEDSYELGIISTDPPALQVGNASDNGEIRVFDDSGKRTHIIQSQGEGGSLQLRGYNGPGIRDLHANYPVKVVGNVLVGLAEEESGSDQKQSVIGVDLTTGQRSWVKEVSSESSLGLTWVRGDDPKKVVALDSGSYDTKPQILTIDPAKQGAVTKGDKLDTGEDSGSLYAGSGSLVVSSGDTLVLLQSNPSDGEALITAYGPK